MRNYTNHHKQIWLGRLADVTAYYEQLTWITSKYPTRTNTNNTEEIGGKIKDLEGKIKYSN